MTFTDFILNEMYDTFIASYFETVIILSPIKIDKVCSLHRYPSGSRSGVARNNLIKHLKGSVFRKATSSPKLFSQKRPILDV